MKRWVWIGLFALLAACSGRPSAVLVTSSDPNALSDVVPVFYATLRGPSEGGDFGHLRETQPQFGRARIAVPAAHEIGKLEVAKAPDPAEHFTFASNAALPSQSAFKSALRQEINKLPPDERLAVIFVHGFNNNFAEGLFRHAQLMHDFEMSGVAISYAWPSRGAALAYAYDRDSALFARDGLEQVIRDTKAAGAREVLIIAHSMGSFLTMEALRQMAIANPAEPARSVNAVALMAPDVDVEVFRGQMARISNPPDDMVVFVSKRDRALALSARLSGESNRLGNVASITQVADLDLTILDVTEFASPTSLGHLTVASSPALIRLLWNTNSVEALIRSDTSGRLGLAQAVVLTAQEATAVILSPVTAVAP